MNLNPLQGRPVAVIPARYGSIRYPGKPLALIAGKPMIFHVHQRCLESEAFAEVLVATEDLRIVEAVEAFGGRAVLTSPACASGTDRVAEVARGRSDVEVFINVQGDEPAVHPESLRTLAEAFAEPGVEMATLVRPLEAAERPRADVVKVVLGVNQNALYFSRADIPHARDPAAPAQRWVHLGLYGYRRPLLLRLAALPPSALEQLEGLEQLRALENGIQIACRTTAHRSIGVDRPEDRAEAEAMLARLSR